MTLATENDIEVSSISELEEPVFDFAGTTPTRIDLYDKDKATTTGVIAKTQATESVAKVIEADGEDWVFDFTEISFNQAQMAVDQRVYNSISEAKKSKEEAEDSKVYVTKDNHDDFMQIDDDPFDLSGLSDYLIR